LNKKKIDEASKNPVKAKVFQAPVLRHWIATSRTKRQHLFVMNGMAAASRRDAGDRDAYPTSTTFETGDNFSVQSDGQFLVFTAVPEKGARRGHEPRHLPRVDRHTSPSGRVDRATLAADSGPVFSPDGKKLLTRSDQAGYEADNGT